MTFRRVLIYGGLAAAAYFAVFGGEYSIFDLRRIEREMARERRALDTLRHDVGLLRARIDSLESDPAALERLARERYGLIRDGERLYRFVDSPSVEPDTAAVDSPGSDPD